MKSTTLFFIFLLSLTGLFAQTFDFPSNYSSSTGASDDPYFITSLNNLYWLSTISIDRDKHYVQTQDIDASSTNTWNAGEGFAPIGDMASRFSGSYDGQGFIIDSLYINRSGPSAVHQGLFGLVEGGTIRNLGLTNVNITGRSRTAGIAGYLGYTEGVSTIENCYTSGEIHASEYFSGGLAGSSSIGAIIVDSYSTCSVDGSRYVGGLVGWAAGGTTISNSYSNSMLSATSQMVGGIVGYLESAGTSINRCYSKGMISGDGSLAGGIAGQVMSAAIINCYSTMSVNVTGTNAGGLVGLCMFGTITNCYSNGFVSASSSQGGLIGTSMSSTITNSYFDTATSGQATRAGGTGKTTSDMKTESSYSGWDFTNTWDINLLHNLGYPYFQGQQFNTTMPIFLEQTIPEDDLDLMSFLEVGVLLQYTESHIEAMLTMIQSFIQPSTVGELPEGIDEIGDFFWEINAPVQIAGKYNVTFDLTTVNISSILGEEDFSTLVILKRDDDTSPWQNVAIEFPTSSTFHQWPQIRVEGIEHFSEFTLGSGLDPTLPVELSSFTAIQTGDNFAQLGWVTQSESNMLGFNIYRSSEVNIGSAELMNSGIIAGTNTSTEHKYIFIDTDANFEVRYYYWLEGVELDGQTTIHNPISIILADNTEEEENMPGLVMTVGIQSIYPNPFNPSATISYYLDKSSDVSIEIYNVKGRLIDEIKMGTKTAGQRHKIVWDGKDRNNKYASSGIYFFKLKAGNHLETTKALLMK